MAKYIILEYIRYNIEIPQLSKQNLVTLSMIIATCIVI